MPPIDDRTTNRNYQKPNAANTLADDVTRLRSAFDSIDTDVQAALNAPGATGAGGDTVFFLNGQTVTTSFSIPSGKNAITAGPVTINTGITVTVPSGSSWVIV